MTTKVYSIQGQEEQRSVELNDSVFALPYNNDVIWYAVNNELANRRLGTADTLTRSEVHGSNAKPYRQKGTGRARRGDKKSPVLVGGGIVFGPHPKDFSYSMPKKAKQLAIKTILSAKVAGDSIKVVEDFTVESCKTKDFVEIIKNFVQGERTVVILRDNDEKIKRAGRNVPYINFLSYNRLSAHTLFYARKVILLEGAVSKLNTFWDKNLKNNGEAQ
jgi:large subunit ribosomal protein L4